MARRLLRETARVLLEALAPLTCAACGRLSDGPLCGACRAALEPREPPACTRCGEPILRPQAPCPADHAWLQGLDFVRAPWRYRGAGGAIVRRLKFEGDAAAITLAVRAMADAMRTWARGAGRRAIVVHVPMHRGRRRQRGFDQAERIAVAVAQELGLVFGGGTLTRRRATLSQTDPRVTSREGNVDGAFSVRRPALVVGQTVLLVDDVTTSGSTARACAAVLRAAGARSVVLLTAAVG